ncbi:MAG: thiamine pyrophosphate-dependent enzyme, partial [Candidatus Nanopelagicales bacterium]|nr:thiamine pyrophosphate-dependent enzyme [Candidatus Nanopelagicales bacterium]
AKGAFPDSHPANLGMPGMHGTVPAVGALQRTDLIIALGTRFDDRVTGQLASFAPGATVIHADIDPAEIGKNVRVDVPIVGDAKAVITELIVALRALRESGREGDYEAWWASLDEWRRTFPPGYEEAPPGEIAPQDVISRIGQVAGPDAYYVTGVGQHQMWSSQFIKFERAGHWLTSGGLGTMGYCVPATMGAKVGAPDNVVWGIDGDGSFQMTNQELATCTINEIPVKIAIINNGTLGMVRQWQTLFYNQRYSNTDLNTHRFPDFVKLAEAYGCHGLRCEDPGQVDATIEQAMSLNDAPVVVDFQVHKDAMVWPMVPAGTSNDAITIARDLAPAWDREE